MPNVGMLRLRDAESGQVVMLDTASRSNRRMFAELYRQHADQRDAMFRRLKLQPLHIETGKDCVEPLRRYFYAREARR